MPNVLEYIMLQTTFTDLTYWNSGY